MRISLAHLALSLVIACFFPTLADATTPPAELLRSEGGDYRIVGQGRMRWFGLLLYDAALWVDGSQWQWDRPFALDIRYARDFSGEKLAEASAEEIKRLGSPMIDRLPAWREAMRRAFPDVRKGDVILGLYRPGVGAQFYHNGRPTALVQDADFARAFFSIWLDPRTREPRLRAALLGQR